MRVKGDIIHATSLLASTLALRKGLVFLRFAVYTYFLLHGPLLSHQDQCTLSQFRAWHKGFDRMSRGIWKGLVPGHSFCKHVVRLVRSPSPASTWALTLNPKALTLRAKS